MGVLDVINVVALGYFGVLNLTYLALTIASFPQTRRYVARLKTLHVNELVSAAGSLPISLLVPAFNEESTIVEATRSLLTLRYPEYEIIVISDGSTDGTIAAMTEAFELRPAHRLPTSVISTAVVFGVLHSRTHPHLWLIDKENGGKADALNVGLNYSRYPLFAALDADTLLEPDALIRIARPFLEDQRTVAAGAMIRIANGCKIEAGEVAEVELPHRLIPELQIVEYLRAFFVGRIGWDAIGATLIVSGAFGVFRRSIVAAAGGFSIDTVGEDMELIVRLHRYCRDNDIPYRVSFIPDPVAWTEAPETLQILGRQRSRWQRGLAQVLTRHISMLGRPRYGTPGMLAFPYYFFLELLGPIIETVVRRICGIGDYWRGFSAVCDRVLAVERIFRLGTVRRRGRSRGNVVSSIQKGTRSRSVAGVGSCGDSRVPPSQHLLAPKRHLGIPARRPGVGHDERRGFGDGEVDPTPAGQSDTVSAARQNPR